MKSADGAGQNVVEVENLVSHYGERKILDGVDLSVRRGEIMVVMGRSGSGKSTLLRHVLGLSRPTAGCIRILGQEITRMPRKTLYELRKQIGVAFQGGALFGSLSVVENIELPLREHTRLDERTIRIMARMKLEMMRLGGCEDLMPAELSGGMLKRAALARAVAMDPKLLFFDEPSAGLDPITAVELDDLIVGLKQALKMTIVVITHELESALQIADRISVMRAGRIIFSGSVADVRASPDPHVQDLLNRRSAGETEDHEAYLGRLLGERG